MNFLKNYSKISRISYRSYRTFVNNNKGTPGSFSSGDNNSQSSSNQPKTKSFSSEFATSNTSTSSSTSGNEFPPTGTSKYDNIYNKPAENLTSPHNTSTPFDRTSSTTQENISGAGRSETLNIPRGQPGFDRQRSREPNVDYASRRDSASSTLQDLANTAANLAGSAVKGVADVVASGLGNQSNQRLRTPYDDPRYSDIYNDRHQDRYDDRNANNAANIVGTVVKGIADTASNVASNFIPGSRGSQDNRNRGIAETVVETAVKSAVNAAGSVVSSFIPGNQNRPNRDYDDYRDRERDRYRPNDNSPISSAIQGLAGAAKTVANVAGTVASNLGSAAHDSRLREPYEDDRYRNRDRYNNDRYDDRRYERYNDRNADRERYDERYSHRDQTSETVHNVADQINQGAQAFAKNTREAASRVSNSAGDFASTASNIASGVIGAAGSAALHAATTVAQTFNTTTSNRRSFNRARRTEGRGLEQGGPSVPAGSKSNYEIIISGGGVNGGALACALGHSQFFDGQNKKILVLDPFEAQPIDKFHTKNEVPDQRVVSLSLGSVNFLKELGVWDIVNQERLGTINQMQVWEVGGNSFIKFNEDPSKVIGYVIENNHLQAAIYERMRNLGNIELLASKVVDVRSEPNSFATVVLNNEDVLAARLVVGSDGTNSLVRNKARIPTTGWSSHQTGIVCTVKTQDHNTTAWQRFMSTGPLAVLPLWDEYSSIVWSCETNFHQSLMQLNDEDFLKELNYALNRKPYVDTPNIVLSSRAAFELPPIVTGICNKRRTFPLGMQQADQFVAERVALIGDAAHNVHPLAGQGLNLGLTDAAYLANVIVKNLKTGNDYGRQDLLIEYETLSQNINKSMMYGLEFIKRSYETNQYDPIVFARNLATGFINNLSPMKGLFTDVANGKFFQPSEYEWKKNN